MTVDDYDKLDDELAKALLAAGVDPVPEIPSADPTLVIASGVPVPVDPQVIAKLEARLAETQADLAARRETIVARYRVIKSCGAVARELGISRTTVSRELKAAGEPLVYPRPKQAKLVKQAKHVEYLQPDQFRLAGHDRQRAIVANLATKGLSVEQIVDVTGYTIVAVRHHLETARLRAHRPGNGKE